MVLIFKKKWSFSTSHGHLLWSLLHYHYLKLISDQNDVERCAIQVSYLHTSHYGQKHIDFIWIKVKMLIFLLFGTSTVLFGTFLAGSYQIEYADEVEHAKTP